MKAIVFEGPEKISVKEVAFPQEKEGWVLVEVSHAGICGSDMTIFWGKHPRARAPLVLGHEFSGRIASDHPTLPRGTLVTSYPYLACGKCQVCESGGSNTCTTLKLVGIDLDGGMAEYVLAPSDSVYAAPKGVSPKLAAFIEPIGISVHAMRHGGYRPGDRVAVFGAGAIGLAVAITLRQYGAGDLMICESNPQRLELARSMGFDVIASGPDALDQIYSRTDGRGADCVFDCAGHQSVIDVLPDAVRINGRIVIVAGYKNPPQMNFQKGMMREFVIQFVRNCTRQDFEIACSLTGKSGDYEKLLNCVLPIERAEEGFDAAIHPKEAIKVMFCME
ncbi:MAG: alcohol dehydrogenase catalytic domain-containing protein [Synergistaceae bacterium]|jgi:2-desacetyl-2-hydroxyethyl bacteriochlorophyllide A dehydrogenase|nr:alcohol dehydrogenase catalytic domain-containing protein [Synergistaceae bacterium]